MVCEEYRDVLLTAWENEQALIEKKEKEVSGRAWAHRAGLLPPGRLHHGREDGKPGPARSLADCLPGGAEQRPAS